MRKLTSLFLAGMVATVGCVSAIGSVSADDGSAVSLVSDSETGSSIASGTLHKGDKIEFTVTGYSEKAITGAIVATYINQEKSDDTVEYTDKEVLRYADGYYTDGEESSFYKSAFEGYQVRPESADEFDRDKFGYCYVLGKPEGTYKDGQFMYSFAVEVVGDGSCWVNTVLEDGTFENEAGEPESDLSALKLKTEMKVDYAGEVPTAEPTEEVTDEPTGEVPTAEPTDEPTGEVPTEVITDVPTSATNTEPETTIATQKTTTASTSAPTSANNGGNNNTSNTTNSSTTGKVATGSNSVVAVLACAVAALLCAFAVRKRTSR